MSSVKFHVFDTLADRNKFIKKEYSGCQYLSNLKFDTLSNWDRGVSKKGCQKAPINRGLFDTTILTAHPHSES